MPQRNSEVSLCVKYLLFFFNVFFWIIGGGILGIGLWARYENTKAGASVNKITDWDLDPAWLLIAIGFLMFNLGFCGCIGALRENIALLKFFSISLSIIFFLQLAGGVIGFVFRNKIKSMVTKKLEKTIISYRDNPDLQNLIDYTQETFKCCGLNSYDDWDMNIYFNCSSPGSEGCGVPYSCCITDKLNTMCGYGVRKKTMSGTDRRRKIYTSGCIDGVTSWFKKHLIVLGAVEFGVALLQVLGIGFSTKLISDIRKQMAKWERPRPLLRPHHETGYM
ncbi:tetraspanin-5-like [Rhopilema esculentum]|uniref:tetraspanin-5-like n=1 Tax=Rhopilema esculentum TaxID=499914 RepID=UPI0031D079CB|eukprot:gene5066-179_t